MISFESLEFLNNKIISVPQSAGINSAAALCALKELEIKPKELHIFYAHFDEHSPDSLDFVKSIIQFAEKSFENVKSKISYNSVLDFFLESKMIPHPAISPCSKILKILPLQEYNKQNNIEFDLIGYVKEEQKRINRQQLSKDSEFTEKVYPIKTISDEECFEIVKRNIGWYPKIYDIKYDDKGFISFVIKNIERLPYEYRKKIIKKLGTNKRVFKHNNCLPCKNMYIDDMLCIEYFYPDKMDNANFISKQLKAHWGRSIDDFYSTFGREDFNEGCKVCNFD